MASQLGGNQPQTPGSPSPGGPLQSPWFTEFYSGIRAVLPHLSLPEGSALAEKLSDQDEVDFDNNNLLAATLQIETMRLVLGFQDHITTLNGKIEVLASTVKTLSNNASDLSTNVAANTTKTYTQAQTQQQQQQPRTYASAAATPHQPQNPKTPAKGKKRLGTDVHSEEPAEPGSTKEDNSPKMTQPKALNTACRRIYATRKDPAPLADSAKLEANISVAIAKELQKCGYTAPTNLQIQINPNSGTVSLTTLPTVDSKAYENYLAPMSMALLKRPSPNAK
ncbi:hypothetical protein C7212DRAFT_364018 [Tuber magnatum]|uniref:Uncharacterized protein n=1 Tax=Tuber magnatum TaxID=42249 RepID=A0A317SNJ1_9PEZI|nr:hypothetical protein C7212DRAFT_364018 [Tuber magnatum]